MVVIFSLYLTWLLRNSLGNPFSNSSTDFLSLMGMGRSLAVGQPKGLLHVLAKSWIATQTSSIASSLEALMDLQGLISRMWINNVATYSKMNGYMYLTVCLPVACKDSWKSKNPQDPLLQVGSICCYNIKPMEDNCFPLLANCSSYLRVPKSPAKLSYSVDKLFVDYFWGFLLLLLIQYLLLYWVKYSAKILL